jgi:hypothetical protein
MNRRTIESLFGAILFIVVIPFAILSAIRARVGSEKQRSKWRHNHFARRSAQNASGIIGEFHNDRAIEAYENLIDTVVSKDRS